MRSRPTERHRSGRAATPPDARRRARRTEVRRRVRRRAAARPPSGRGARRARPRPRRVRRRGSAPSRTRPCVCCARMPASSMVSRQPRDGLVDGLDAGAHGVDLAGQPGQPLAAVGFGAHRRQVCAFGLGGDPLALGQLVAGRGQPVAGLGQLGEQLPLVLGHLVGLGLQRLRVGAAGSFLFDLEVLGALAGDADRRADPFGQCRQPKPALLGGLCTLAQSGDRRLVGVRVRRWRPPAGRSSRRARGAASSRPGWCCRIRLCG